MAGAVVFSKAYFNELVSSSLMISPHGTDTRDLTAKSPPVQFRDMVFCLNVFTI